MVNKIPICLLIKPSVIPFFIIIIIIYDFVKVCPPFCKYEYNMYLRCILFEFCIYKMSGYDRLVEVLT